MKTLLTLVILTFSAQLSPAMSPGLQRPEKPSPELVKVLKQINRNNPKLPKQYSIEISKTILSKSKKYGISPRVLAAILMQESSYKLNATGIKCGISITTGEKDCVAIDFGIGQINHKTIKDYNFDQKKLMTDVVYSIDASAKVLSHFKRFQKSEPNWYCRYNVGTGGLDRIGPACQTYTKLVARHM